MKFPVILSLLWIGFAASQDVFEIAYLNHHKGGASTSKKPKGNAKKVVREIQYLISLDLCTTMRFGDTNTEINQGECISNNGITIQFANEDYNSGGYCCGKGALDGLEKYLTRCSTFDASNNGVSSCLAVDADRIWIVTKPNTQVRYCCDPDENLAW